MTDLPTRPFINGEFRQPAGEKPLRLVNPANDEAIAEVKAAGVGEINMAVDGAHLAFQQQWRDIPPGKRTEILFNIARHIRDNAERLAQTEMRNIGKPIADAAKHANQLGWKVARVEPSPGGEAQSTTVLMQYPEPGALVPAPGELALVIAE